MSNAEEQNAVLDVNTDAAPETKPESNPDPAPTPEPGAAPVFAAHDMWLYSAEGPRLFSEGEEIPAGYEDHPDKVAKAD